jgi:predicted P-loop ATPase
MNDESTKKLDEVLSELGIDPETMMPCELSSKQSGKSNAKWQKLLRQSDKKKPKADLANTLIALRHAPEWAGVLGYDEFALQIVMRKPAPWVLKDRWEPQIWTDSDNARVTEWLQHQDIGIGIHIAAAAAEAVATENSFHPIKDYVRRIKWDEKSRLDTFASVYLGAEETPYTAAVCKAFFVAAIARLSRPGCKHDHVLILEGPQGALKSSAIDALFSPWFSDDIAELGSKDSAMQVRVAWGIEIPELAAMQRGEIERVKAFVARRIDIFRPSYGRYVVRVPRQSVFAGTTNSTGYLKDETGGRRFWPIKCGKIDLAAIKRDKDQLWAEALHLFRKGHKWWLTDADVIRLAKQEQSDRFATDPWHDVIAIFLETKSDTSVGEILAEAIGMTERAKWSRGDEIRVGSCLTAMGWLKYRRRDNKQRQWRYRKLAEDEGQQ